MKLFLSLCITIISVAAKAQSNYALDFNGTSQYVSISAPLSNNTSYTKEAWVYSTSNTGSRNIISSTNAPFWINAGVLSAGHGGNYSQVTDATTFPLNKWTHVAVTYDAATTTMRLYRDGILVNTNTGVASNYSSETTYIASHSGAGNYLQGMIDEVRIWNVARTQVQLKKNFIEAPANNASGLAAYFKLNNGSGSTATNSTGGTDGTLQNTPTWVASPVEFAGNALNFDGTDDVVNIADNNSLDITTAITIEAWVFATKNTGIQNVVSKSSQSVNNGYIFPRTDNGWSSVITYLHISGTWRTLSATYPSLNAWHHLAVTYDGSNIIIYIDGVLSASQARTGAITANGNILALGNQPGYSEYFGGSLDEVRIWNIARTQAQIQAQMFSQLDPSTQIGLVTTYTFNQGITAGTNTGMTTLADMKSENNGTLSNFSLTGSTSNFVMQNATLPLDWLSFSASEQNGNVRLAWSTAAEQNTREFVIQHSANGSDWKNIGTVGAAENSNEVSHYNFVHVFPNDGVNYYRIRQTDLDGGSSVSEIRLVTLVGQNDSFAILKNPVQNGMIDVRANKGTLLLLYGSDGRLLFRKQVGNGIISINMKDFPKGIYFLKSDRHVEKIFLK